MLARPDKLMVSPAHVLEFEAGKESNISQARVRRLEDSFEEFSIDQVVSEHKTTRIL